MWIKINKQVLIRALQIPKQGVSNAKLQPIYEGPYYIKNKISCATYVLVDKEDRIRGIFHSSLLKKYYDKNN